MPIKTLFIDADETIFDFKKGQYTAFNIMWEKLGLVKNEEAYNLYDKITPGGSQQQFFRYGRTLCCTDAGGLRHCDCFCCGNSLGLPFTYIFSLILSDE